METCMILHIMRTTLLNIERVHRNAGGSQLWARISMARQLGIGLGTLENIIRLRVKTIRADLRDKIHTLWIKTIEAELARLEHEREMALKTYASADPSQMAEMEIVLEKARALLRQLARGKGCAR